jgi:hypothetical protein
MHQLVSTQPPAPGALHWGETRNGLAVDGDGDVFTSLYATQ